MSQTSVNSAGQRLEGEREVEEGEEEVEEERGQLASVSTVVQQRARGILNRYTVDK